MTARGQRAQGWTVVALLGLILAAVIDNAAKVAAALGH